MTMYLSEEHAETSERTEIYYAVYSGMILKMKLAVWLKKRADDPLMARTNGVLSFLP